MPVLVVLSFILQLAVAVHVIRTGRETFWIWLVLFVPVLGALIYILTQVLPDLGTSRRTHRARAGVGRILHPGAEVNRAREALEHADTVANRVALGDALMAAGQANRASAMYASALAPPNEHEPDIMRKAAAAAFEQKEFATVKTLLNDLRAANPDYRSDDAHLLYARALEALEDLPAAREEYAALVAYFSGEEAAVRYARLMVRIGAPDEARTMLNERLQDSKRAPAFYRKRNHDWLLEANTIVAELDADR